MAEKKEMHIENIKKISSLIKDGNFDALIKFAGELEKEVKGKKVILEEKLKALEIQRKEKDAQQKVVENTAPVLEEKTETESVKVLEKPTKKEEKVKELAPEQKAEEKPVVKIVKPTTTAKPAPAAAAPTAAAAPVNGHAIKTPLPGVIIDIKVNVGDTVTKGQTVVILEAMKMENNINSDKDGKVASIAVAKGDTVADGAVLVVLE